MLSASSSRYFVDTSALLARFLTGTAGNAWMKDICDPARRNTIIIAEITEAELAAALNQLVRGGAFRKKRCEQALTAFWNQIAAGEYQVVSITSQVIWLAADLCGVHALRGYDAVQLAAAMTARDDARVADAMLIAGGMPALGDPMFLTEDIKLRAAAVAEVFLVDSPLTYP